MAILHRNANNDRRGPSEGHRLHSLTNLKLARIDRLASALTDAASS